MNIHNELLTTEQDIAEVSKALGQAKIIAFDTEFIRETSFFPKLELMQVATKEDSWLIDIQAFRKGKLIDSEALAPLAKILEDPEIVKVVHAGQADQECLYHSIGIVASPLLDTALAASLCGYGDGVGLANLLRSAMNVKIKKGHARTNWAIRPLPPQQAEYAHQDVIYLVEMAEKLLGELDERKRREWAFELSAQWNDTAQFEPRPVELYKKLARSGRVDPTGLNSLMDLLEWRETRVRELDVPRKWLADDSVIMDLARVRPSDESHLKSFRGLNKGELRKQGDRILEIIKNAGIEPRPELPEMGRSKPATAREARVQELLRCYLGILADEHRIALRHLMPSTIYLQLIRSKAKSADDLVKEGLLTQGASRLVGDEILQFLGGEIVLTVKNGRVQIIQTLK